MNLRGNLCDPTNSGAPPWGALSNRDVVAVPDDLELSDSEPEKEEPAGVPQFDLPVRELISSSEDDDADDKVATRPPASVPQSDFSLRGESIGFQSRSRSIFDQLDGITKGHPLMLDDVGDADFAQRPPAPPLASDRKSGGAQGGGAAVTAYGRQAVPDYLVHPERWTRYDLEDVAMTSDSQNSAVAQQYLLSLQQRKQQHHRPGQGEGEEMDKQPSMSDLSCGQVARCKRSGGRPEHRIVFSRPTSAGGGRPTERTKSPGGRDRRGGRSGGLSHLEDEEHAEDDKPAEGEQRKRKWAQRGSGEERKVEEEEEQGEERTNASFNAFKKAHCKNYRRASEQDTD